MKAAEAIALGRLITAVSEGKRADYLAEDNVEIVRVVLRRLNRYDDVLVADIEVTTLTGLETTLPVERALQLLDQGGLRIYP